MDLVIKILVTHAAKPWDNERLDRWKPGVSDFFLPINSWMAYKGASREWQPGNSEPSR